MTDLTTICAQANALSLAPDEDKLEAFLQSYQALPEPANIVEAGVYGFLLQFSLDEFHEVPCECKHEEQA